LIFVICGDGSVYIFVWKWRWMKVKCEFLTSDDHYGDGSVYVFIIGGEIWNAKIKKIKIGVNFFFYKTCFYLNNWKQFITAKEQKKVFYFQTLTFSNSEFSNWQKRNSWVKFEGWRFLYFKDSAHPIPSKIHQMLDQPKRKSIGESLYLF
jgi:hypothetical protein